MGIFALAIAFISTLFGCISFGVSETLANIYQVPPELKDKYKNLYDLKVIKNEDGSHSFHNAKHWVREGIDVIYLNGDRFEMAYQHGRLLNEKINSSKSLIQASKISENAIINNLDGRFSADVMINYTQNNITNKILEYAVSNAFQKDPSAIALAEAYGLSEATDVPVETILHAALGPETAQTLLGITSSDYKAGISLSNCSSFSAWDSATESGEVIIGRNTDYPLNGFYDKNHLLIYFDPTDDAKKYMTATSVGFHNAGVYGYNEEGIYVGIHTVPTTKTGAEGMPVFMLGQEILRQASNLNEAIKIVNSFPSAAGWNYHIVSTKEKKAVVVEKSNEQSTVRKL